MLAKKNRFRRKKDFERVFKEGRGFREDFLILRVAKNNAEKIRFGFIVSKKVSKKANVRNKIKRIISESIRLKLKINKLKPGIDAILIVLPQIEKKDFFKIDAVLEKLFKRAKILIY